MSKEQKKPVEVRRERYNKKIDAILEDYPKELAVYPRENFLNQLGNHLRKHGVGKNANS